MKKVLIVLALSIASMTGCDQSKKNSINEALTKLIEYYEEIERNIGPNEENYNPNEFALEASRGELRSEYFGIKMSELAKDANGNYTMTDEQRQTFINNLLGTHNCTLQWIGWENPGKCTFAMESGALTCKGGQRLGTDYLEIDGKVEVVNPIHLRFTGVIKTRISYIANGQEVARKGVFNFKVRGKRAYWRMQEINNPVDGCADYVDIYFE